MMSTIVKSMFLVLIITINFAFINTKNDGLEATYGVSENNPSQIELKLNKNYTFSYQDFSNPNNKIKVQGTYVLNNQNVILNADNEQIKFHSKWKIIDNNGIKSRRGLTFYTLRKK